jgi:phytoene desaturase
VTNQTGSVDWSVEAPRYRKLILRRLEEIGIQDLERRIRTERVITPADWESEHRVHRGAVFNLAHSMDQMLHKRPGNRFADVDGLYLTGGGTHPGSGLPVIFESARISSDLLCKDLGISDGPSKSLPGPASAPSPLGNTNGGSGHAVA